MWTVLLNMWAEVFTAPAHSKNLETNFDIFHE